jgi:hypothetical protein
MYRRPAQVVGRPHVDFALYPASSDKGFIPVARDCLLLTFSAAGFLRLWIEILLLRKEASLETERCVPGRCGRNGGGLDAATRGNKRVDHTAAQAVYA